MAIDRDADNTFNDAPRHILDEIARFVETERRRQFIEEAAERSGMYLVPNGQDGYEPFRAAVDWQGLFDKVVGDDA